MFSKLLIANRGEIACRIIRTTRQLGIAAVAVYSEADRDGLHVAMADEAFFVGPSPPRESYLDQGKILAAAHRSGAQAIHPGYGFLSENADFAQACAAAGFVFIGPPPAAIRTMGDKAQAKALMAQKGVPFLPGYHGAEQSEARLAEEAEALGFPVLIKAVAGGGGKGMKIVTDAATFGTALASAKREALSAFGEDRVLLERYLPRARHIEVQIFADRAQNFIDLFDRDCSIQRRHQKIIEEAPAANLSDALRQQLRAAALAAARAVGYVGAGTVEFLVSAEDQAFYFLEMNTRLQVEHRVTEMITGLDLVAWQIRVAAGERLPLRQEEVVRRGHSIEARLYAEDPSRGFLPQRGRFKRLCFETCDTKRLSTARIDLETGFREEDGVPPDYDPLILKLIVWEEDRARAIWALHNALGSFHIAGISTNLGLLRAIVTQEDFCAEPPNTDFITHHAAKLLAPPEPARPEILAMAGIGLLCERASLAQKQAEGSADRWSPWYAQDGFRLNGFGQETLILDEIGPLEGNQVTVEITPLQKGWRLDLAGSVTFLTEGGVASDGIVIADLDGQRLKAIFARLGPEFSVFLGKGAGGRFVAACPEALTVKGRVPGRLIAPMPGRIAALLVEPGTSVAAGQPLLVLEAMKMEHLLTAPEAGVLKEFLFKLGSQVPEGAELIRLETG
ncbi:MAG TPA: biotin carboxylase N-terminal domain-containing protein [Methylocella sp.]|nr:biotin carboxylase N-terminal domain-containing protein [Methylocella sp.]